jgi:hypothetical protein
MQLRHIALVLSSALPLFAQGSTLQVSGYSEPYIPPTEEVHLVDGGERYTFSDTDIQLTSPIPEPSGGELALVGVVAVLAARRMTQRRK